MDGCHRDEIGWNVVCWDCTQAIRWPRKGREEEETGYRRRWAVVCVWVPGQQWCMYRTQEIANSTAR